MVPKIIHCCWFGGPKTGLARKCRASWERFAPDWEVREFALPPDVPPFTRDALAAGKWAMASDWARMRALFDCGGVYLDYDVELVRPFAPPPGEWVAGEWTAAGETWMNPGSGIALEKGSAVARCLLDAYERTPFDAAREMMPWINARLKEAAELSGGLAVLDPEVLSAVDRDGKVRLTGKTLGIHHYALSWGGPGRKILQWLCWHGCRRAVDALVKAKRALCVRRPSEGECPTAYLAGFWEEHCLECAMPDCYGSCPMFARGWHGRCVRVDGFEESVRGTGAIRFRRWGKVEQAYHGRLVGEAGARRLERANAALRGLWILAGKWHRAVRWRLAALFGRKGAPGLWQLTLKGERDETLCAAVATADGREVWRTPLPLAAGETRTFRLRLPEIGDGVLFRLFPLDGEATGSVTIVENAVCRRPSAAPALKCVAWDLDGTLWDGTLSEGDDVKLRADVMETVKALDAAGVVNSICSKNDLAPVLEKLKAFGIEEYFVFPQVGWGPKSAGVRNLAKEMNVALDALALVDDREENRNEVAAECPGVRVLDARDFRQLLRLASPAAQGLGSRRREMYREEMARRGAAKAFGDPTAFLAESGLRQELLPVEGDRVGRCLELVNRTNQLTITGRRYDARAFADLLSTAETRAVRAWDRYGDYGIVGFVAWDSARLVELVFSCRVAGKGIERKVLETLPQGLAVEVVRTARNAPIRRIVEDWRRERGA